MPMLKDTKFFIACLEEIKSSPAVDLSDPVKSRKVRLNGAI